VIEIGWRRAADSEALEPFVRDALQGAPGAGARLVAAGRERWESSEAHGLESSLLGSLGHWQERLNATAGAELVRDVRALEGRWRQGAFSVKAGPLVHVFCGWTQTPGRILRHEILHYYLRRLLPPELVWSDLEEKIVQYETCWYRDDREFDEWKPRLAAVSFELNRMPFEPPAFSRALKECN
jgi:hypothetical protein